MAARSAAAQQELRAMVHRESRAVARGPARKARGAMARATFNVESRRSCRRAGGAGLGAAVHRISARLPRRALCDEPAAAGAFSDAGQSRGFTGADLCA